MNDGPLALAHRALAAALDQLAAASDSRATADEVLSALTICEGFTRRLDHLSVTRIAELTRRGTFTERGYPSPAAALADLIGCERGEAGRRVRVAEHVGPRSGLDGRALPPRLPATAQVFATGATSLRHVETITRELTTAAAGRLAPPVWAAAEHDLADKATRYTPGELGDYARTLIDRLDQDGTDEHDPPAHVNTLLLRPRADGSGGKITADLDALLYEAVATAIDAAAKPLTAEDGRVMTQRQADALGEICGYVGAHGSSAVLPACGGQRPQLTVVVRLEDLENRARRPARLRLPADPGAAAAAGL